MLPVATEIGFLETIYSNTNKLYPTFILSVHSIIFKTKYERSGKYRIDLYTEKILLETNIDDRH